MIRPLLRRMLPAASTPRPAVSLRSRIGFWAGILLCLGGGILAGVYFFFPSESLRQRLEQEAFARAGLQLSIGALRPLLPPALEASDIRLAMPATPNAPLVLERLRLRPLWASLVGSDPGAAFAAELFGGRLLGTAHRRGALTLDGRGLKLLLPLPRTPALAFAGNVRELTFAGAFPPQPNAETRLQLIVDDCAINGLQSAGFGNDRLPLGTLSAVAGGRGTTLRIERLTAEGGALLASGEGTLLLANTPLQSRLNLNLTLRPGSGLDPLLAELLPALAKPAADGTLRLAVSGTLANPTLR